MSVGVSEGLVYEDLVGFLNALLFGGIYDIKRTTFVFLEGFFYSGANWGFRFSR